MECEQRFFSNARHETHKACMVFQMDYLPVTPAVQFDL